MIITVGHTKGGVGKSTMAVQIAIARTLAGKTALLVNADKQRSSSTAIAIRDEDGRTPTIECWTCQAKSEFTRLEMDFSQEYDDIIIDAGGRDNEGLRYAMLISNAILVPIAPISVELWEIQEMGGLIDATRQANPDMKAFAFLNKAEPGNSQDNLTAIDYIKSDPRYEYIDTRVQDRKAFATGMASGLSIAELKRKDRKAETELNGLLSFLFPALTPL